MRYSPHMASRKRYSNPSTKTKTPWGRIALGAVAIGIPLYLLTRSSTAEASPLPAPTGPKPTSLGGGGGGGTTAAPTPQVQQDILVRRLEGSRSARQIFNVQAVAYEFGFTDARPDGLFGGTTQRIINAAQAAMGQGPSNGFNPNVLGTVRAASQSFAGSQVPVRPLPMELPPELIASLDADARASDSGAVALNATTSSVGTTQIDTGYLSQLA